RRFRADRGGPDPSSNPRVRLRQRRGHADPRSRRPLCDGNPSMSATSRRAIVIGGGIIGTSCAYSLTKAGWDVTVVEGGKFGKGSSASNCGLVCPSHVLPLAEPGA